MKLKDQFNKAFAIISLLVIASFSFTRKSYAMVPERPEPAQMLEISPISPLSREAPETGSLILKDSTTLASTSAGTSSQTEIVPEIVPQKAVYTDPAARTVTGFQQSTAKERVASESNEQLIGTEVVADTPVEIPSVLPESDEQLPGTMNLAAGNAPVSQGCWPKTSALLRRTVSAQSISRPSRGSSGSQKLPPRRTSSLSGSGGEGTSSNPFRNTQGSVESVESPAFNQREAQPGCCSRLVCGASKRPAKTATFDLNIAKDKAEWWNERTQHLIRDIHKPQPLGELKDLTPDRMQMIFGGSEPRYVLSYKSKPKVAKLLKEWKKAQQSEGDTSCLGRVKGRRGKKSVLSNPVPNYSIDNVIFEDTVPEGYFIESRLFVKNYLQDLPARDNYDNKLKGVFFGEELWALANEEKSKTHFSSGGADSSTHADLYLPKDGKTKYACACCISNHTGKAREPFDPKKLFRTGTLTNYKRYRTPPSFDAQNVDETDYPPGYNPVDVVSNPLDLGQKKED